MAPALLLSVTLVSTLAFQAGVDAASPPGAVLYDSFGRTDSDSLGRSETGQPWVTWAGSPRVVAQQAELAAGGYSLAVADSGTASGSASVTVAAASSEHWLVFRASDNANYWRFGRWQGGTYQLQQVVNHALGSPALSATGTVAPANGDRLSCQIASMLSCSVNGTTVVSTSDSFNATARFVGIAAAGTTASRFDEISMVPPAASPDLRMAVAAGATSVPAGAAVSWTATVTNPGQRSATAATITVTPPVGVTGVGVTTTAGSCAPSGSTWTCSVGDRAVGSSVTVTVDGTSPSQPGTLTLSATVAAQEADANPADNSASASIVTTTTVPGAAAADGFDRPDAASLGQAPTGQTWNVAAGAAHIASQQAEARGEGYTLALLDSTIANGTASVNVPTISGEYWLVVRASSGTSYWRFGRWQNGAYQLQLVDNNALGSPAVTLLSAPAPAAGDSLSCVLSSGLTCSVNGTVVVRTTDPFNASATSVGFAGGPGATSRFDDLLVTAPEPGPDLRVTLTGPGTVNTGGSVSWSGTVTNGGNLAATGTVVTVKAPADLGSTTVTTSSAGACTNASGTWSCNVGTRAVNSSLTVSITGTAPSSAGTLTVNVSTSAKEADLDPSTNSASASTTVQASTPAGTVVLDGFNRPDSSALGQAETGQTWATWVGTTRIAAQQAETTGAGYTLAALDTGTAAGTAALTVTVPSPEFWLIVRASDSSNYWRFGRWQGGPYQLQQVIGLNLGPAAISTSATLTPTAGDRISCKLGSAVTCSVNGTVVATTTDGFNATARHAGFAGGAGSATRFDELSVTTPPAGPDLRVALSAASSAVQTGAAVSWTATVWNDGTSTATSTTVTVTPPSGMTNTSVTSSVGTCWRLTSTWRCSVGNRAVASSLTVTVTGTAPASPTTLTLTVSASAQETDTDPGNNTASASVVVRAPAAPGSVVTDSFDRPNSTTLGQTDTGQPWSTVLGKFGVTSGVAAPGASGTNLALVDPGWQFGTYEVTVKTGAAPGAFAVVVRGRDADNHVRIGPDSSGYYRIWKVVNGSSQSLQFLVRRADVAPRDGDVIRIVNRPDDGLFLAVNGKHVLDAGDQALLTESRFGLVASSTAVGFDSVWISQVMSSGVTTADSFNRPNGTPIDGTSSESGTHYPWRASPGWQTQSGRLVVPGWGRAWVDATSEVANAKVEVHSGAAEAALIFRYDENGDYYRFGHAAGGSYVVERIVASKSTVVARSSRTAQLLDVVEVRQWVDGRIECLVNGVRVAYFVDTTFNRRTTGYGLEGNAATFDNFSVTPAS